VNDAFSMVADVQQQLAANLRRLRIARRLSLSELARATTMSKATLSGIENGRANPTVETLATLAGTLGVALTELLEQPPLGEIRIVRAGRRNRDLDDDLVELRLKARTRDERAPLRDGTRLHVYVLEGTVVAGPIERISELGAHDYASFPADVPHLLQTNRHAARVLLATRRPRSLRA
jgi:transcriptional regulator with XRE-family HTH domain